MFIAKDGFLLYYGEKTNPNASHFDTKPKVRKEIVLSHSRSPLLWPPEIPGASARTRRGVPRGVCACTRRRRACS
jgi:hypothetical protein